MSTSPLPHLDFVVIGAYKAATTSIHLALRAHRDIFVPARKEPSYHAFDGLSAEEVAANPIAPIAVTDPAEYAALFADRAGERLVGEVSPEYLKNPRCAERLALSYPGIRLVAILRDPAERAFSDYLMYRRDGLEPEESFARALDLQDERREAGLATGQYLVTGLYGAQLSLYYDRFPAEQILVLRQDELASDRRAAMGRLAAFLDVDPAGFEQAPTESNRSGVPTSALSRLLYGARRRLLFARSLVPERVKRVLDARLQRTLERPELGPADRERLAAYYAADIALTEQLTGLDLSAWRVRPDNERGA
jgi:hypothetical protein